MTANRSANEDAVVVDRWLGFGEDASFSASHGPFADVLLAVADGLGGHSAGDVASRMVIEGLAARAQDLTVGNTDGMTDAITAIDDDLRRRAASESSLRGMGSTLAMAVVSANALTVLNIGDSRIYFSRDFGEVRQISVDDVPHGRPETVTQDGPGNSSGRRTSHLVTQALGGPGLRRSRLRPHIVDLDTSIPWTLLLCSDGLTDYVGEKALMECITSPTCCANDLVALALAGGGGDNVSVVLARCDHP